MRGLRKKSSFKLINKLAEFLNPLDVEWFVSGGWAIDIHLGINTRDRGDLDISVPWSSRLAVIEFFLNKGWQIEGKYFDGFKTLSSLSDYEDVIRYFWSFPKGVDFIGEYMDEQGNRRISYDRQYQSDLDYIEVFFDTVDEKESFIGGMNG